MVQNFFSFCWYFKVPRSLQKYAQGHSQCQEQTLDHTGMLSFLSTTVLLGHHIVQIPLMKVRECIISFSAICTKRLGICVPTFK